MGRNIHPDESTAVRKTNHDIIEGSGSDREFSYRFRKEDGSYANVMDNGRVIRNAEGKAVRILGSMNDVTERLELEGKLLQSQKMEAVGHMTGGVAHDFNNLLAILLGNFELIQFELDVDPIDRAQTRKLIEAGEKAVKRGADLTNSMLACPRKARLEPKTADLNKCGQETEI